MDLSKLSDEDLIALKGGDYGAMSDSGLQQLRAPETAALPERFRGLPEMSAQPQDRIWRPEDALGMVKNIPGSAMNLARETISAASNPMETLQTFGGLVESGVEAINPFMTDQMRGQSPYRPVGEAFVENIKTRYGTPRAITETIKSDPVGALADVSGLTTGVGGLTRSPSLVRAGVAADPFNLAMNAPRAAMSAAIPEKLPAYLYQKSAKFPPAQVPREVREPAIETALSEKILPTYGGIDKITGKLDGLDERIGALINAADESGKTIARRALYSELSDLRRTISAGADAPGNMRKYTKVVKDLDEMLKQGPDRLTPSRVQKFKTQTYKDINWRGKPNAKTETLKALARGARKAMEDVTPEIGEVNRAYGPLAELRDVLTQPAQRIYNRNPVSLPTAGTATAGGVVGGPWGAALGAVVGMAQNPTIMAGGALGLRGMKDIGPAGYMTRGSPGAQLIRQGLLQSGRLEELMR